MSIQNSVAQFLSVLGGSANPGLFGQSGIGLNTGDAQFRAMLMSQFGGAPQMIANEGANQSVSQTNNAFDVSSLTTDNQSVGIWQIMNAAQSGGEAKNSLVLQLSRKGMDSETIDNLVAAMEKSDLVTILQDPALAAQLDGVMQASDIGTYKTKMNEFIQSLSNKLGGLSETSLSTSVAEMDLDEFKEWKKANFGDLAAFLTNEKTTVNANGQVVKVLQGPAFLAEDGEPTQTIVKFAKPQKELNSEDFIALHFALLPAMQQLTPQARAFNPLPLDNVQITPAPLTGDKNIAAGQQGTAAQQALGSNIPTAGISGDSDLSQGKTPAEGKSTTSFASTLQQNTTTPSNPLTPQNAAALGNMDTKFAANNNLMLTPFMTPAEMDGLITGGSGYKAEDSAVAFEAGFKTASHASNPVLTQPSAGQTHPATQMVAATMTKVAANTNKAEGDTQKYRLQLDPPEMGRVDVELEFDAGHKVKVVIAVEKPETLHLLQRDSHALMKALQDAGFDGVGDNNLEFNLSQGQDDTAGQGDRNPNGGQNGQNALLSPDGEHELEIENTNMSLIVDPVTGQQRVNMVV